MTDKNPYLANSTSPKIVAYLRTSTDDKSQDVERQLDLIKEWVAREGLNLVGYRHDEGKSGWKSQPFDRPAFNDVLEVAMATKAKALVIESADRLTRNGAEEYAWVSVELKRKYGLDLWMSDMPMEVQQSLGGAAVVALKAELGKQWVIRHSQAVRSGMARAKKAGKPMGRPAKPFSPKEHQIILNARMAGKGWGTIAAEINETRGVHKLADGRAKKKRSTSGGSVAREYSKITAEDREAQIESADTATD